METKKINIKDIALFIVYYLLKNEVQINHLKLHKILYYIQAWHLVYFNKKLIFDELPEAWVNGPVYRSVYNELKSKFKMYDSLSFLEGINSDEMLINQRKKLDLSPKQFDFLEAILKHYGLMSHEKLVYLAHSEMPWNKARIGLNGFDYSENKISSDDMYSYYSSLKSNKSDE